MFGPPQYEHTQTGWIHWLMYALAAAMLCVFCLYPTHPAVRIQMPVMAVVFLLPAFLFRHLTVRDESERLAIEFGPLPLFRRRVPYAEMLGVGIGRTSFLNGWGIHYCDGGWLWNIAGYDCVVLELTEGRTLRIGTDEPEKLCEFLRSRLSASR